MNAGVTFERVYHALKDRLGSGRFVPGQHLEPAALSPELNASVTPVRDALHRLAGEGLVETPRGDGFRTPLVTEVALRHLYRWNAALLKLAAQTRAEAQTSPQDTPSANEGTLETTERVFAAIAARPGNPEHAAAVARLNDRLRPIRRAELAVLADCDVEIEAIAACLAHDAPMPLRRSLAAFHRRRERHVGEIVAALVAAR